MTPKFLNDDWLKQQISEEEIEDSNFTHSTMQRINLIKKIEESNVARAHDKISGSNQNAKRWEILSLGTLLCTLIGGMAVMYSRTIGSKTELTAFDLPGLLAINITAPVTVLFTFALIWLVEEYDLL